MSQSGKISKSNQDPKQIDSDRAQLLEILQKKSPHFEVGTGVVMAGRRGQIVAKGEEWGIIVEWDDTHTTEILRDPRFFWNRG